MQPFQLRSGSLYHISARFVADNSYSPPFALSEVEGPA